jgi:hypothetical protein
VYRFLADVTAIVHFLFVVFVIAGGLVVLRWPRVAWVHIPAAMWGTLVEVMGWVCPLTPLEDRFRRLGGSDMSEGDFISRFLLPVLYPERLTLDEQRLLGALVIAANVVVYAFVIRRRRRGVRPPA